MASDILLSRVWLSRPMLVYASELSASKPGRNSIPYWQAASSSKSNAGKPEIGGANRNRTDDLLNAIQALSQLSYGPGTLSPVREAAYSAARIGRSRG